MILHISWLSLLSVVQLTLVTSSGRKYRSLGRVDYNENSFRCPSEGFHPDLRDCRSFYRCVDYSANDFFRDYTEPQLTAFRFECGEGTVFDPDFNVCNHPFSTRRAECGGRRPDDGSAYPQPQNPPNDYPQTESLQNSTGGIYAPHPPYQPENQYRPPHESENQVEAGSSQMPLDPSEKCQTSGFFPVKGNCQKFARCVDNGNGGFTKYEFSCGPGTVWDPMTSTCNYPSAVPGCGDSGITGQNVGPDNKPEEMTGQVGYPEQEGYPGSGGQGGYPVSGGRPGQGEYPGSEGQPGQGGYPGSGGQPGQGEYPGSGGRPGQGGYPVSGGRPGQEGYPGSGGRPGQGGYPGSGGRPGQEGYPGSGGQGGYPGSGGQPGQGGYPGSEGRPGQGGYPGSGGQPGQGGYPGSGGQGGYPGSGGQPGQEGYPGSEGQGGYPGSGDQPGEGGYPGSEEQPGQENIFGGMFSGQCTKPGFYGVSGSCKKFIRCVDNGNNGYTKYEFECGEGTAWDIQLNTCNYASQVRGCENFNENQISSNENGIPEQGGYPEPGQRPGQGEYPGPGQRPGQGGYPGPDQRPGQGGYPGPDQRPGQGGYPGPDQRPGQGGYPGPDQRPGQGGYPGPDQRPGQGGYPGPDQRPGQGGYPGPDKSPGQGGYPGPDKRPGQGGYPAPAERPGQGEYPGPGQRPGQGGYPRPGERPGQEVYPSSENFTVPSSGENEYPGTLNPPAGNPSECQNDGFHPVKGECRRFFRCVQNDNGGYRRYDFQCGEGTVWDQENQVCNYPHAVYRSDANCQTTSSTQSSQTTITSSTSTTHSESSSSYYNSTTSMSQSHFGTTSSMTSQTGSSQSQWGTTSSSQTQFQGSQTTSGQQTESTSQVSNQTSGGNPEEQGYTKPMKPQVLSTTAKPKPETSGEDPSKPPSGSSPCDQNKIPSKIQCTKAGFYPVPNDCKKFYRCVDWDGDKGERFSVYYFECGKGTVWDPALETCNHEESVYPPRDCGSPSSEGNEKPNEQQSTTSSTNEPMKNMSSTTTAKPMKPSTTTITTKKPEASGSTTKKPQTTTPAKSTTESSISQTSTETTEVTDFTTTNIEQTDQTTNPIESSTEGVESSTLSSTESTTPLSSTESTETTPLSNTESMTNPDVSTESSTPVEQTEEPTQTSTLSQTDSTTVSPVSEQTEPNESTPNSMVTTESPEGKQPDCPQLNEDQSLFVCPTGFRRHPKDCNMFYQCTVSKDGNVNIMTLLCKNDTIYDERKIQCLPPEETDSCQNPTPSRRTYRRAYDDSAAVVYVSPYKRLCPSIGSFSYEGDCSRFYKCKKDGRGKIQGYLYQCPENFSFWTVSQRCEPSSKIPQCTRSMPEVTPKNLKLTKAKVPTEYFNIGTL